MGGNDHDAIEETVRAYLLAHETEDDRSRFCAGPLRRFQECVHATTGSSDGRESTVEVARLVVAESSSGEARVDLAATWRVNRKNGGILDRFSIDLTGPMRLAQLDGSWRIVDHMREGASLADGIVEYDPDWQGSGDVRVSPVVSRRDGRFLHFYFKIAAGRASLWGWECWSRRRLVSPRPTTLSPGIDLEPGTEGLVGGVVRASSRARRVDVMFPLFDRGARRWRSVPMSLPLVPP